MTRVKCIKSHIKSYKDNYSETYRCRVCGRPRRPGYTLCKDHHNEWRKLFEDTPYHIEDTWRDWLLNHPDKRYDRLLLEDLYIGLEFTFHYYKGSTGNRGVVTDLEGIHDAEFHASITYPDGITVNDKKIYALDLGMAAYGDYNYIHCCGGGWNPHNWCQRHSATSILPAEKVKKCVKGGEKDE